MRKFSLRDFHEWPEYFRASVIIAACLVVFIFVYVIDLSALFDTYAKNRQKNIDIKTQLESNIRKQIAIKKELIYFNELQKAYDEWQNKVINYRDFTRLVNEILKAGTYNNVHFNAFNPMPAVKGDDYTIIPIKATAIGSYHQLANFVSQVANMPYIVSLGNYAISLPSKTSIPNDSSREKFAAGRLLTGEFNFEVYSLAKKN